MYLGGALHRKGVVNSSCTLRRGSFPLAMLAAIMVGCGDSDGTGGFTDIPAPNASTGGSGGSAGIAAGGAGTSTAGGAGTSTGAMGGTGAGGSGTSGTGASGVDAGGTSGPGDCETCGEADCVDLQSDPAHCGDCGQACDPGEGCTGGQCGCGATSASFSADVLPILTARCASPGCHSGMRPQAGLSLTATTAYALLVGVAAVQCNDGRLRIAPGLPAESYLMSKLLGVDLCAGTQMPKSGQSLPASELGAISAWICAGAAND